MADTAGDIILVADSIGNVCPGRPRYVSRQCGNDESSPGSSLAHKTSCPGVADMPFLSFHLSLDETICTAGGFLQRGAGAVKLDGGAKRLGIVRALVIAKSR
ncbi:3-methyl-2-oxobutanoate hydroxymethyltransferase [Bradyrhizobium sp. CCBAU 25360]|uniref:3-methyl-2-oxobutanoate hydroxymethyltransferase n=1 Tax=Bradyrhizobium sp. CCBAU 25360 TaxID=858425 RepID=UPI003FA43413